MGRGKMMVLWVLLLSLLWLSMAQAQDDRDWIGLMEAAREQEDTELEALVRREMPTRLYPAQGENGLWGYINCLGEWAMEAQFDWANHFRGEYAAVCVDEKAGIGGRWGIIDKAGNWELAPEYFVDEGYDGQPYGGLNSGNYQYCAAEDKNEHRNGFFDVPSGYASGLKYDEEIRFWGQSYLMLVLEKGEVWYVDRATGEKVLGPPDTVHFDPYDSVAWFRDGYVLLKDAAAEKLYFLSEKGTRQDVDITWEYFPNDYGLGMLVAQDMASGLWGYLDAGTGAWGLAPQWEYRPQGFSSCGYALVQLTENTWGHIDRQGELMISGVQEPYTILDGLAYLPEAGTLRDAVTWEVRTRIPKGYTLVAQDDDEMRLDKQYYVTAEGMMEVTDAQWNRYLLNSQGEFLLPCDAYRSYRGEWHRFFSGDRHPVVQLRDGKVGYADHQGNLVVDCVYDDGSVFLDALAEVDKDGKRGYIDRYGREVYFWSLER